MQSSLIIGTRGSALAQQQSQLVEDALSAVEHDLEMERRIIQTAGDMRQDIPLNQVNRATDTQDKGVFIAALEEALAAGEIDCAVHSLKDMPGILDPRFEIAAVLPREAKGDVLIIKQGAKMNQPCIGTSSVRRMRFAESYWSGNATCLPIRGNVATRLNKLVDNVELDAIILARAGLNRLGYPQESIEIRGCKLFFVDLSLSSFMPALGQGAIAIECRKGDQRVYDMLRKINDSDTETCVRCERAFLAALQANCSTPVGGYAIINQDAMYLRTIYYNEEGQALRVTQRGAAASPEAVGEDAFAQLQERLQD